MHRDTEQCSYWPGSYYVNEKSETTKVGRRSGIDLVGVSNVVEPYRLSVVNVPPPPNTHIPQ